MVGLDRSSSFAIVRFKERGESQLGDSVPDDGEVITDGSPM